MRGASGFHGLALTVRAASFRIGSGMATKEKIDADDPRPLSFFESLLALLLVAILLSQVARRISVPYPTMLAAAGLVVALVPGAPTIDLDPHVVLALFIAPALLDAAFDFPLVAIRALWKPLVLLAVLAVVLTTALVAGIGWAVAGMPLAAAVALGAIVAPPDAAASNAILNGAALPRRTVESLKGESLLNDGTALLIFGIATAVQAHGGMDASIGLQLGVAAPGGIVLGIALAWLYRRLVGFVSGTLGGNLLEFVNTFWVWIIAERLHLSAVLCVVAFAMTIARSATVTPPRVRVHSYAVWGSVVFLLNVLAFLFMGMQARTIVGSMSHDRLIQAAEFSGLVVLAVIVARLAIVLGYNWLAARFAAVRGDFVPENREGLLVGWCGMRGLVTLATAFALPGDFPQRDLIVLTAFSVVIATLVVQGLTLGPLIRLLGLESGQEGERELARARVSLADAGLAGIARHDGKAADHIRHRLTLERESADDLTAGERLDGWRTIQLEAIAAQRARLADLRNDSSIGADAFETLQEELDWKELSFHPATEQEIEES